MKNTEFGKYNARIFNRYDFRLIWHYEKLRGVLRIFREDVRCVLQRLRKGYCNHDVHRMNKWFLHVIPDMLQQLSDEGRGFPVSNVEGCSRSISPEMYKRATGKTHAKYAKKLDEAYRKGQKEWRAILDRMAFLFREADVEQCGRNNPYEAEYREASRAFRKQYGRFGEKLMTEEERASTDGVVMHDMDEIGEYRDIYQRYHDEEKRLKKYRCDCKDEAFKLLSEWLYALWD